MKIITYPGTGTNIIQTIMDEQGIDLEIITDLHTFHRLDDYAGLILLGGRDIVPSSYGERRTYSQEPDTQRDRVEWAMIRQAMSLHVPIFGICRGCQMIAIAHGGSLYQDIYRQNVTDHHPSTHQVEVGGKLAKYMPTKTVNSLHHQAIRNVPDGFKILAHTDGIVEAIYKPGVLGVQWHPELLFPTNPGWFGLFEWFLNGLS